MNIWKKAFENPEIIAEVSSTDAYNINTSEIATILIQNTGRFVERYASDFLYNWSNVCAQIEKIACCLKSDEAFEPIFEVIPFGLRENGVDHANYIESIILNNYMKSGYLDYYYRKIFAVAVSCDENRKIHIVLKNIGSELSGICYHLRCERELSSECHFEIDFDNI